MTPQERDLIAHLFDRLAQAESQAKDRDAEATIRDGMSRVPDAPYLLVQTVLIQDMALAEAEKHIKELEAQAKPAAPEQPTSFLAAARGSVPSAGPWGRAPAPPSAPAPSAGGGSVWTNSAAGQAMPVQAGAAPSLAMPGASSGFLRSAATTAAGIAGGALLFNGISSLFGPHYGNLFGGMTPQPGIGETVINNYYGDQSGDPGQQQAADTGYDDQGLVQADDQDPGGQDFSDDGGGNDGGGTIDI
ncbi:MAG TPA: DUF2076 domain-containing protein [Stellaceae bacterium]|nr:DUF2076 domain-containing protein [Stellaceae bacterium]